MITIAPRFRGPAQSGNGGYTAGLIAEALDPKATTTVTLRKPPPLDTPLAIAQVNADVQVRSLDGTLIATAEPGNLAAAPPEFVDIETALAASEEYRGFTNHPFPTCFTCGPQRTEGDGLRLFTGPVPNEEPNQPKKVATMWEPSVQFTESTAPSAVATPMVWAALDCPGAWAADVTEGRPLVLGRITASVFSLPIVGQRYVVVGEGRATHRRKAFTGTAIYDTTGVLVAAAQAVWFAVDPHTFNVQMTGNRT